MTFSHRLLVAVLEHAEHILVGIALIALGFLLVAVFAAWLR